MKSRRIIGTTLAIFAALAVSLSFASLPVKANSDINSVRKTVNYNILENCYNYQHIVPNVTIGFGSGGSSSSYDGTLESLFTDNSIPQTLYAITSEGDKDVPDPETCSSILGKTFGMPEDNNLAVYFNTMGYSEVEGAGGYGDTSCFRVYYSVIESGSDETFYAGDVCWGTRTPGSDYYDQHAIYPIDDTASNPLHLSFELTTSKGQGGNPYLALKTNGPTSDCNNAQVILGMTKKSDAVNSWSKNNMENLEKSGGLIRECGNNSTYQVKVKVVPPESTVVPKNELYSFGRTSSADIFKKLRSQASATNTTITQQQAFDVYSDYLLSFYHGSISDDCVDILSENSTNTSRVYTDKGWCVASSGSQNASKKVAVFDYTVSSSDAAGYKTGELTIGQAPTRLVGFTELVREMEGMVKDSENTQFGKYTITPIVKGGGMYNPDPEAPGGGIEDGEEDPCYNFSGTFGWIICPATKLMGNAMNNLYSSVIKDFLKIDSVLLSTGDDDGQTHGTYEAWGNFVGFANVILIGFFLVIIFSQLTGVGIDNYGIKKALPKIIIAAVLINASFIICQLLADLSNIVGSGIEGLLSGIGDRVSENSVALAGHRYSDGGAFAVILEATTITAGGGAILGIVNAATTGGILGLLIPLVFGLLIGLIAILFFFTLLGVRKAAIVTLVAVSPIAFACYMLPNLKKIVFDRWFGLIKAMLLVYPLCGLVIGGSNLASSILMVNAPAIESNSFLYLFINLLLMVVPYFMLPSLIKKSMGALGTLTQKASNVARGIGKKYGDRAKDWNNKRGINQARVAARNEAREKRWARRALNGPLPVIGKNRRNAVRDAALQTLQKHQEIDAGRDARLGNKDFLAASAAKSQVEAEKAQRELNNYANSDFIKGTEFTNQQQADDKLARGQRYADATAQAALENKLEATRDKDAKDDALYATQTSLDSALQSNIENATKTMEGFTSSALANKQLKVQLPQYDASGRPMLDANGKPIMREVVIDPDDMGDLDINGNATKEGTLAWGYERALQELRQAKTESQRIEAMARVQTIQTKMMKDESHGGYDKMIKVLRNSSVTDAKNDPVRMVASKLLETSGNAIKGKDREVQAQLVDLASIVPVAEMNNEDYRGRGIDKITVENIGKCTNEYVKNMINKAMDLRSKKASGGSLDDKEKKYLKYVEDLKREYVSPNNTHSQPRILKELNRF